MSSEEMLLAYFQGRLSDKDRKRFESQFKGNPELLAEVEAISASRKVFENEETPDQANAWKRLSNSIDAERFKPANQNVPIRLSLWQVACVAFAAVLGWQMIAAPLLFSDKEAITMASSTVEGPSLQLVFSPSASLKEVTDVLYKLEGTIVGGPTALGVYQVRFEDNSSQKSALEILEKRSDLVSEILKE